MESGRKVYINGIFVPENEAKISIFDSALMFGDMVFEMTRSFNKKQFKLKEHLERLYQGMKILHIPLKMKIDEMEQICYQTIDENEPVFGAKVRVAGLGCFTTNKFGYTKLNLPADGWYALVIKYNNHEEVLYMEKMNQDQTYTYRPDPSIESGRACVLSAE